MDDDLDRSTPLDPLDPPGRPAGREPLYPEVHKVSGNSDILARFAQWVRNDSADVEVSDVITLDFYEDIETTTSVRLDLGVAGEVEVDDVDVYISEYNVYRDEYEVEVSTSLDVEQFVDDYSPVSARELLDALDAMVEVESTGTLPAAVDTSEETAARAALAAVRSFLDGYGADAVTRSLGTALSLSGYGSSGPPADVVEAMRSLIERRVERLAVRTDALMPGDLIVSTQDGGDAARRVEGAIVSEVPYFDSGTLYRVRYSKDGGSVQGDSFNSYREWIIERSTSTSTPGIGYDPLTVTVEGDIYSTYSDLRLGDNVTGSWGRVTRVEPFGSDQLRITCVSQDYGERVEVLPRSGSFYIEPIVVPGGRDTVPTALSLDRSTVTA